MTTNEQLVLKKQPEVLAPMPIYRIGTLWRGKQRYERIIAGEPIPDSQRTAYRWEHEPDHVDLEPVEDALSGSAGFIDYYVMCPTNPQSQFLDDSLYMAFMGVEPPYRRQKIGSQLVRAVEAVAQQRSIPYVWGWVQKWRAERVTPLFDQLGYQSILTNHSCLLVMKRLELLPLREWNRL